MENQEQEKKVVQEPNRGKWALGRMIVGIISMVLFVLVAFQSCAAGLGNSLSGNGEVSGSFGILTAILMLVAGIVGVATRNSNKAGGPITCCVFYWICFFFSRIGAGSYADLRIWGVLAFFFGCVYLFSAMKTKKSNIIAAVIAVIYFILGMI